MNETTRCAHAPSIFDKLIHRKFAFQTLANGVVNLGRRVSGVLMGFSVTTKAMVPRRMLEMAERDYRKLPGMPPLSDLTSVSIPSVLDCRAEKWSSLRMESFD